VENLTCLVYPLSVCSGAPVAASQSRTVPSPDADASRVPSAENATDLTEPVCPSSVCSGAPVAASQSRTVRSSDADASRVPSAENATDETHSVCPVSVYSVALQCRNTLGSKENISVR
jgi:hypothetical protein